MHAPLQSLLQTLLPTVSSQLHPQVQGQGQLALGCVGLRCYHYAALRIGTPPQCIVHIVALCDRLQPGSHLRA
jgi:hypothetical protein